MLGSLIIYLKGMRRMMFQLSGFYYKSLHPKPQTLNLAPVNPRLGIRLGFRGSSGLQIADCSLLA